MVVGDTIISHFGMQPHYFELWSNFKYATEIVGIHLFTPIPLVCNLSKSLDT